ncbi:hypothetical protein FQN60_006979, partial [Etheostoma spectabile]
MKRTSIANDKLALLDVVLNSDMKLLREAVESCCDWWRRSGNGEGRESQLCGTIISGRDVDPNDTPHL